MMPRRPWDRARESYRNGKKRHKETEDPTQKKMGHSEQAKKRRKKMCQEKKKKKKREREKYSDIHKEEMQSW